MTSNYLRVLIILLRSLFNPKKFRYLYKFACQYQAYINKGGHVNKIFPIVTDYANQSGVATGHYFHQDLLVANKIANARPIKHVDIGSRIDGFVAHVASFRVVEVLDIRPLAINSHSNIKFIQANLMDTEFNLRNYTDSLSCLHAIEHFGLGRYGDPLDPLGHMKGYLNLLKMVKSNGILYISFPIATTNSVQFNAHRIFTPDDIFNWPTDGAEMKLLQFDYVDDDGSLHTNAIPKINQIKPCNYGCGIYTFIKSS